MLLDGTTIRLISPPTFIATKIEAFQDRGKGDYMLSDDMEDIIAVIDGRPELGNEVKASPADIQQYIREFLAQLIDDSDFIDAISMHVAPDEGSQARRGIILDRIRRIAPL